MTGHRRLCCSGRLPEFDARNSVSLTDNHQPSDISQWGIEMHGHSDICVPALRFCSVYALTNWQPTMWLQHTVPTQPLLSLHVLSACIVNCVYRYIRLIIWRISTQTHTEVVASWETPRCLDHRRRRRRHRAESELHRTTRTPSQVARRADGGGRRRSSPAKIRPVSRTNDQAAGLGDRRRASPTINRQNMERGQIEGVMMTTRAPRRKETIAVEKTTIWLNRNEAVIISGVIINSVLCERLS